MNAFDEEPAEVPMPEGSGIKEVYAFFGLCAYQAQVLERGVINLAVGLHAKRLSSIAPEAVEPMFDRAEQKTLGQLLAAVRRQIPVPDSLERSLRVALQDRNVLSHHFFSIHDIDFVSDVGRESMIRELRAMTLRLQRTDRDLDEVTLPLWASLGVTKDMLSQEFARMMAQAEAQDVPS